MGYFNESVLEVFAHGIMDAVAEYISNIIGYENQFNPGITLEAAYTLGFKGSAVDDSYERYGIETIFRLLEHGAIDIGIEDIYEIEEFRQENVDKVMELCTQYYIQVFKETCRRYPGVTVDDFMNETEDYGLHFSQVSETELVMRSIIKVLKDHDEYVNG